MMGKLQFFGTGSSWGVPLIGCTCSVCCSPNPRNQRMRSSALLKMGNKKLLIDAGPDFRSQALRFGLSTLHGVLLTHSHYDHIAGIDDLRSYYYIRKTPLPFLLSKETADDIKMRYHYLFPTQQERFHLQVLSDKEGKVIFEGLPIEYVSYIQSGMTVTGYRVGSLAYISDIRTFNPGIFERLKGVKTLIISALKHTPSDLHFSVEEAIDFAKNVKAEKVWLTHISHELDHEQTNAILPANVALAYDGLEIEAI